MTKYKSVNVFPSADKSCVILLIDFACWKPGLTSLPRELGCREGVVEGPGASGGKERGCCVGWVYILGAVRSNDWEPTQMTLQINYFGIT